MNGNTFVWYELVTGDVDAALAFYRKLLGWQGQEFPGPEGRYVVIGPNGKAIGGVMALPAGMTQPFWLGYISVTDADAAVTKLQEAGATIHKRMDIPQAGRIALVTDRQGAAFAILQRESAEPSEAFDQSKPGHGNWHELHTTDWQDAQAFYSGQFGWTEDRSVEMGPMGTYQLFAIDGAAAGAMFNDAAAPRPHWLFYFGADDIDAAARRVADNGGAITQGPLEVPGGAWIVQATDPQGARFALVGPRKAGQS